MYFFLFNNVIHNAAKFAVKAIWSLLLLLNSAIVA